MRSHDTRSSSLSKVTDNKNGVACSDLVILAWGYKILKWGHMTELTTCCPLTPVHACACTHPHTHTHTHTQIPPRMLSFCPTYWTYCCCVWRGIHTTLGITSSTRMSWQGCLSWWHHHMDTWHWVGHFWRLVRAVTHTVLSFSSSSCVEVLQKDSWSQRWVLQPLYCEKQSVWPNCESIHGQRTEVQPPQLCYYWDLRVHQNCKKLVFVLALYKIVCHCSLRECGGGGGGYLNLDTLGYSIGYSVGYSRRTSRHWSATLWSISCLLWRLSSMWILSKASN